MAETSETALLPIFPPRTVLEHVDLGILAGAGAGLLIYGAGELLIDHDDHSMDAYAYIGFPLIGAAAGAALGFATAKIRGAPSR